ncbi:MAG: isoprenyl transferase [Bacteroidales bacterium]|nr:isoprenyl transferase [Bacteroidales bacterium]
MTLEELDPKKIPQHIAIIMDGNGRWAKQRMERRLFGHRNAITAVRQAVETAARMGVSYLTLYAFSTENWNRMQDEVDGLMALLASALVNEIDTLISNNVRLRMIGDIDRLPADTAQSLRESIHRTSANTGLTLILALSYSARWELTEAMRAIAAEVQKGTLTPASIDEKTIAGHLSTADFPDPDLLIRTGGELRLSNFLLWQLSYAEFYFTDLLWPDFRSKHLIQAVGDYQQRQRRYGKSGDQVEAFNS